jgi:hypothetical protein
MFSGLKKFISSYPQLFFFEANQNFNPKVHMHLAECAPEVTARGSIPCSLAQSATGSPPQQMLQGPQMSMAMGQGSLLPPPMSMDMHDLRDPSFQQYMLPVPFQQKAQPIWENWDQHPGSVMSRQQNSIARNYHPNAGAGAGQHNPAGGRNFAASYYDDDNEYFDDERYNLHGYQEAAHRQPQPPSHSYPPPPNLPSPSYPPSHSQPQFQQTQYKQMIGPKHSYHPGQSYSGPTPARDMHNNNAVAQHSIPYNHNNNNNNNNIPDFQRMRSYPQRIFK